jgi:hypothetical protein
MPNEFKVKDRVQDVIWDGRYTGTVQRVDSDGCLFVAWDGLMAEDQMRPNKVVHIAAGQTE